MLDGSIEARGVGPPRISLVLGGTWMCPKLVGIVFRGADVSFDMWDLCGSRRDTPYRKL